MKKYTCWRCKYSTLQTPPISDNKDVWFCESCGTLNKVEHPDFVKNIPVDKIKLMVETLEDYIEELSNNNHGTLFSEQMDLYFYLKNLIGK